MSNPYGGSGSIVVTPRKPMATPRRLGSAGWRLTDTKHGKAIRRTRNGKVTTNRPQVERILPTLDDDTQVRLALLLTSAETHNSINIHDK